MGMYDLALRCARILCNRAFSCIWDTLDNVKTRLLHGGRRYELVSQPNGENTGLFDDDEDEELGLTESAVLKNDKELYEQVKAIVEKKAKKRMDKLKSPPKSLPKGSTEDEDAWLDSLKADDGV